MMCAVLESAKMDVGMFSSAPQYFMIVNCSLVSSAQHHPHPLAGCSPPPDSMASNSVEEVWETFWM